MLQGVPNETDWGDLRQCLDMKRTYGLFYGRTANDIPDVMRENPLSWIECMNFMPDKVFDYYVLGFCQLAISSKEIFWPDEEVVTASFLSLINGRMQSISEETRQTVVDACSHLARNSDSQTPDEDALANMFSTDIHAQRQRIDNLYQEIFVKHQQSCHNQSTN
jgi:hypothetical protein